jgi:ferric-dicitrate binding protein FerR (iron transport regulator)
MAAEARSDGVKRVRRKGSDRAQPRTILTAMPSPTPADERPMGRTYALVILCHAAVITTLWWIGHVFSR